MTTAPSRNQRITLDDFMTGLLAALASSGARAISIDTPRFHAAVHAAFCELENTCTGRGPQLAFWITRHPVYRDSADIREGIARAAVRALVTFDSPRFVTMRSLITKQESSEYLENLPGTPDIYQRIAAVFLSTYTKAATTQQVAMTGGPVSGSEQIGLDLWPREYDLPPRWDGLLVEWGSWSDTAEIFMCPPRPPERCKQCRSVRAALINSGKLWIDPKNAPRAIGRSRLSTEPYFIGTITAFRCPDCGHDSVLDNEGHHWDLDPTDYTEQGSWDVAAPRAPEGTE